MKPFPRFSVQRVELSPPCLVGQLSKTTFESETWVQDGWVGFLRSGSTFIAGRWRESDAAWLFVLENAESLRAVGPPCEFEVFDGYWGERAELVLDESLNWQPATWSAEPEHDHCRICWGSLSGTENREHFVVAPHVRICGVCYTAWVKRRSLSFIVPRPAA